MQKVINFLSLITGMFLSCTHVATAHSSLGIGPSEPVINPSGSLSHVFLWIQSWQREFEQTLSEWFVNFHQNPSHTSWIILISFIYGILHALGPGHGKAVVTSYLIASNGLPKHGIFLSFISSLMQAITAISLVLIVFFLLPAQLTKATKWLTTISFLLVMCLGLTMLIRKTPALFKKNDKNIPNRLSLEQDRDSGAETEQKYSSGIKDSRRPILKWKGKDILYNPSENKEICTACGRTHTLYLALTPDYQKISWKSLLTAVFSIGLRPCSGAIFIMSFSVLNGLFLIGCLSVITMSLGTFITVSALAAISVYAKNFALKITRNLSTNFKIRIITEWLAALFIFISGFLLFLSAGYRNIFL